MKQMYFFTAFILFHLNAFQSFSQTYKIDLKKIYSWGTASNPAEWKHEINDQYEYANNGDKETKIIGFIVPSLEQVYQINKTYDANNNIILESWQYWDGSSMQWINGDRVTYTYDGSNNLKEETREMYSFFTMQLVNDSKELYDYNGSNMTKQTSQDWDVGTNTWVNEEQLEINYTANLPTDGVYRGWNSETNMWDLKGKVTRSYNMNDLPDEDLTEAWKDGDWSNSEKSIYTYVGLQETELLNQIWDETGWVDTERILSTYDNGNKTVFILENWDLATTQWLPEYKEEFSFSLASGLSVTPFKINDFKVFPNPVSNIINIESSLAIDRVEVFNILGEKVLSAYGVKQLNVEHLQSGMYLLKAYIKNRSINKKVLIK